MKKGKFGIVLCFYPIVAFAAVILQAFWLCALALAVAVFFEKDEWSGRQTLQAGCLAVIVWCFKMLSDRLSVLIFVPILSEIVRAAAAVLFVLVYLCAIVLSVLAILRVMKEQEAGLPLLSDLAHRVYGQKPAKPVIYPQPYGQPSVPQFTQQPGTPPAAPEVPPEDQTPQA